MLSGIRDNVLFDDSQVKRLVVERHFMSKWGEVCSAAEVLPPKPICNRDISVLLQVYHGDIANFYKKIGERTQEVEQ